MQRPSSLGEGSNAGKGSKKKKKRMTSNKMVGLNYSGNGGIPGSTHISDGLLPDWVNR